MFNQIDGVMSNRLRYPDLAAIIAELGEIEVAKPSLQNNVAVYKHVHGGLLMTERHALDFDPREEYWRLPERRVLVALFARRWHGRHAPVNALRRFAIHVFRHFDRGRADGLYEWSGVDYARHGGWNVIADRLIEHAQLLPDTEDYQALRAVWQQPDQTAADHVVAFLDQTRSVEDWPSEFEPSFAWRLPWFAYLGTASIEDLCARQAFFYGFASLLMSTNAYRHAGAQSFASVLQNTPTQDLLRQVRAWRDGTRPDANGFLTMGNADEEPIDRAHYTTVRELFGFINLHAAPFINNRTLEAFADKFRSQDPYALAALAGVETRAFLESRPDAVTELAALFRQIVSSPLTPLISAMEGLDSKRIGRLVKETDRDRADFGLCAELDRAAVEHVASLDDLSAAACALHLLIDWAIYRQSLEGPIEPKPGDAPAAPGPRPNPPEPSGELITLPPGLRDAGEQALGYLRAGLHVLFAGAPATGKTTLAQFVGHAWDANLSEIPDQMHTAQSPIVTVGNSAWSPFHTIGGLRPCADGGFEPHRGIFIDEAGSEGREWQLRAACIVLDEMNRADLDRCIGELYPLLSGSVHVVHPAGIPGVDIIRQHDRFRVIATVNDMTLDDVVFPISEGLARRFQRIELLGATKEDVLVFLSVTEGGTIAERANAAADAVGEFFVVAEAHGLLALRAGEARLRFGAGYFAVLKKWVGGQLVTPSMWGELDVTTQAIKMLRASLSTMARTERLIDALAALPDNA